MIILLLLMSLIMSTTLYSFNVSSAPVIDTSKLEETELQTFNAPLEQYEGMQSGVNVKTLISYLITNANVNMYSDERLPDITFFDLNGNETIIVSDVNNTEVTSMGQLRTQISNTHTYEIELEYDYSTGLINNIIINY